MENLYSYCKGVLVILCVCSLQMVANAQVNLPLSGYAQNFNGLSSSTTWSNPSNLASSGTLPGWYVFINNAPATLIEHLGVQPSKMTGTPTMNLVALTTGTDKALGAQSKNLQRMDYGVRLKNTTGGKVNNVSLNFDIKGIFPSGVPHTLSVEYQVATSDGQTLTSPIAGAWQPVGNYGIGNYSNILLKNLNLENNRELFVKFVIITGGGGGGNEQDLAVDNVDVKIIPSIYYNKTAGALSEVTSWNTNTDASGANSIDFSLAGQTYILQHDGTLPQSITLGTGSKIIVKTGKKLTLNANLIGTVDLEEGANLIINSSASPSFGAIHSNSTITYNKPMPLSLATYGNLVIDGLLVGTSQTVTPGLVTVLGNLTLKNNGKLVIGNSNLEVVGEIVSNDNKSYIQTNGTGKVRKLIYPTQATEIPLGTTTYAPLTVKMTGSFDVFSFSVKDAISPQTTKVSNLKAVNKTWDISEATLGGNTSMTVTFHWEDGDWQSGFQFINQLQVGHYTTVSNTTDWDLIDGMHNFDNSTSMHSLTTSGFTSFSPFAVFDSGKLPIALPVVMYSFKGGRTGDMVNLSWITASEKDNDYFEVEQSRDGKVFHTVGQRVKGNGTTAETQAYKAAIAARSSQVLYFRLKQVDYDGKFEYSKAIAVAPQKEASVTASLEAYPNPTADKLSLISSLSGSGSVALYHSSGKLVLQQEVQIEQGQPVSLDLSNQPAGLYIVRVKTAAGLETARIVKQ